MILAFGRMPWWGHWPEYLLSIFPPQRLQLSTILTSSPLWYLFQISLLLDFLSLLVFFLFHCHTKYILLAYPKLLTTVTISIKYLLSYKAPKYLLSLARKLANPCFPGTLFCFLFYFIFKYLFARFDYIHYLFLMFRARWPAPSNRTFFNEGNILQLILPP